MNPETPGWNDMVRASPAYFASETRQIPGLQPVDAPRRLRRGAGGPIADASSHYTAWRYLLQHTREPGIRLVHGRYHTGAGASADGELQEHGWVELGDNLLFDSLTRQFYAADAFRAATGAEPRHTYTAAEAARLMLKSDHPGPWSDDERLAAGLD